MKKFHPFFAIGTIGMIILALLHIGLALLIGSSVHATFYVLYPVFVSFLGLGFALTLKQQQKVK